jgi:hypothetical protein
LIAPAKSCSLILAFNLFDLSTLSSDFQIYPFKP